MPPRQPYTVRGYPSLDAFYDAAGPSLRRRSPEVDYGMHWSDPLLPGELPGRRWRVSWIEKTGELYAVAHLRDGQGSCPVRLYGVVMTRADAEDIMRGWEHQCPRQGGLSWIEQRFAARHESRSRG
jgi:hypothetical protein